MKYHVTFDDGPYGDRFSVLKSFNNYHMALEYAYFDAEVDYDELTICTDSGLFGELKPYYPDFSRMRKLQGSDGSLLIESCGQSDPWVWFKDVDSYVGSNYYEVLDGCSERDEQEEIDEELSEEAFYTDVSGWLCSFGIPVKIKK
jgi:hypothetical protein